MAKKKESEPKLYLVWAPKNRLVLGAHDTEEAAGEQARKFAGMEINHGNIHVIEAPAS